MTLRTANYQIHHNKKVMIDNCLIAIHDVMRILSQILWHRAVDIEIGQFWREKFIEYTIDVLEFCR